MNFNVKCGFTGCTYTTGELPETLANSALISHTQVHATQRMQQDTKTQEKTEKIQRPIVSMGCTIEDWEYFICEWNNYKIISCIKDTNIVAQLMACGEAELRKNIYRTHGNMVKETESTVLDMLRVQAVCSENVIVARTTFLQTKQDRDEPVRSYVAKLKGKAKACEFTVSHKCECGVEAKISYSDEMARDVLVSGLEDGEVQAAVLGDTNQDMTLAEMTSFIEAKETGKKSVSRLTNTHVNNALRSTYRRDNNQANQAKSHVNNQSGSYRHDTNPSNQTRSYHNNNHRSRSNTQANNRPCSYCGKYGHGNDSRLHTRRQRGCMAVNHTCKKCNIEHHHESVCRTRNPYRTTTAASDIQQEEDTSNENMISNLTINNHE